MTLRAIAFRAWAPYIAVKESERLFTGMSTSRIESGGVESGDENPSGGAPAQPARAGWPGLRALWPRAGISGDPFGTSGRAEIRAFWLGMAAVALLVGAFNTVNVMSVLHDRPALEPIQPIIWEGSSWVTFMLFAPIGWVALKLAPFSVRPRWRLALHAPALLLFSLGHVVGFVLLRKAFYALDGGHYAPGPLTNFLYEFRKDILGYALMVLAFRGVARHLALQGAPPAAGGDMLFDIRDGARLIRVALGDILAVTAAGNYVEFLLADGRRPLMRSPLSALEAELAPQGFVRTHRSWLVNAARVTALMPEGSGDYRVELGEEAVPLSRRYRAALTQLRGKGFKEGPNRSLS
jgi:hypothetical protein